MDAWQEALGRAMRGQQVAVEAKERQRDTRRPRVLTRAEGEEAKSELDSKSPGSVWVLLWCAREGAEPERSERRRGSHNNI